MNHETHSIRRFAPLCATAADCDSEIALRRAESRARRTIHEQDKRGFYMSENKIEIRDMNLYYGDFHALHDINLDIKANEITAFIGPSGCGKSTLLRSLNRMNDLVEGCRITGDIQLDGQDIYKNCDVNLLRRRVGMVFQKPNPFPMSIYDNIAYGPRTHGIRSRVRARRDRRDLAPPRRHLGRDQGQPEQIRALHVRRSAAAYSASRAPSPPIRRSC